MKERCTPGLRGHFEARYIPAPWMGIRGRSCLEDQVAARRRIHRWHVDILALELHELGVKSIRPWLISASPTSTSGVADTLAWTRSPRWTRSHWCPSPLADSQVSLLLLSSHGNFLNAISNGTREMWASLAPKAKAHTTCSLSLERDSRSRGGSSIRLFTRKEVPLEATVNSTMATGEKAPRP
eukprot:scaffold83273_cov30-Tisochrysis_lutea.AAC.8